MARIATNKMYNMKAKNNILKQTVFSFLCITLILISMSMTAFAEENADIIYVSGTNGDDSYAGTSIAPVKTIEQALELAEANDIIQILDSASTQQLSTDEPLRITKAVTITGGSLTISRGGIVLGNDVAFQDISINMINSVRNAIIANGYTLTLENVHGNGTYPVHLFCGTVTGYTGDGTLPEPGEAGSIIISGTNNYLSNLYAGSLSEYGVANEWTGSAAITISAGAGGTIGDVYAHGATEPRGEGDGFNMFPDSTQYIVAGAVDICLSGSQPGSVYGITGGVSNADITITGGANLISNLALYNPESLTVSSGKIKPGALNENLNITIASGAELNLSEVIEEGTSFQVGDFTGGGRLVMGQSDKLRITGEVTGTTELQISDNRPMDASTSGIVEYSFAYIDVTNASGAGTFTLIPYFTQYGTILEKLTDNEAGTVAWTTSEAPQSGNAKPSYFEIPDSYYTMTMKDAEYGFEVPVDCEIPNDGYFGDVPLSISISKDGGTAINAEMSYGYGYVYSVSSLGFEEILGDYGDEGCVLYFYTDASILQTGNYVINISVELDGDVQDTQSINLRVTDGTADCEHMDKSSDGKCDICGEYMDGCGALAGYSLSLDGNIGVNFHMELEESVLSDEDAYMQFTLDGAEYSKVKVSEATSEIVGTDESSPTYYVFKCGVPAKDIESTITAQIVLGDNSKGAVYTYTVKQYADYILDDANGYNTLTKNLVTAMLRYGEYATCYFGGAEPEVTAEMEMITSETLAGYVCKTEGTLPEGITYYGSSLLLKSETIIRHYFNADNTENLPAGYVEKNGMYYYDITNISAEKLGTPQTLIIGDWSISYSALSYAYTALERENTGNSLKNLAKAIYLYYQVADAYANPVYHNITISITGKVNKVIANGEEVINGSVIKVADGDDLEIIVETNGDRVIDIYLDTDDNDSIGGGDSNDIDECTVENITADHTIIINSNVAFIPV